MKVYVIPVKPQSVPKIRAWPEHSPYFNIETDFLNFISKYNITDNPNEADFHYLPIMWTYWMLSNNYGKNGREEMQRYLNKIIIDDTKTFTVSEADDEPGFEIGKTVVFSGNQTVGYHGHKWVSVPIVTLPHRVPDEIRPKMYLSNFVGNTKAWKTRIDMVSALKDRNDIKIIQSKKGEKLFVDTVISSYSTLCPRGSALGSYRFYESMQLGIVPIMISDEDFRPFPKIIDWDSCSYYFDSVEKLPVFFDNVSIPKLIEKGLIAERVWKDLSENWPRYVLDYLYEDHS